MKHWINKLLVGDNLPMLRDHVSDESVDLVYLDPPFNKQCSFNILFNEQGGEQSPSQVRAFEDTWRWGPGAESCYQQIMDEGNRNLRGLVRAFRDFLGTSHVMAYLSMMAPRLQELHRVLKSTGSLFLHCDPTSSHYLKLLLDAIFGPTNFQNEIVWRRTNVHNDTKRFGRIHDIILFYSKSSRFYFLKQSMPLPNKHVEERFIHKDERGRYKLNDPTGPGPRYGDSGLPWQGFDPTERRRSWAPPRKLCEKLGIDNALPTRQKMDALLEAGYIQLSPNPGKIPMIKCYLEEEDDEDTLGSPYQDIWAYQPYTQGYYYGELEEGIDQDVAWIGPTSGERVGYPTQKPQGLLARIITSACPPRGIVLDPFCGCGSAVVTAEALERRWIGIDITHLAITIIQNRLDRFKQRAPWELDGDPKDIGGVKKLLDPDPYQFQWWALGKVRATVTKEEQRKGADRGIDGRGRFVEPGTGKEREILYQVKAGAVSSAEVRDLRGTLEREQSLGSVRLACLISLKPPTREMIREAACAGFYTPDVGGDKYERLQLLTAQDLLDGKQPAMPHQLRAVARNIARPSSKKRARQGKFWA